MVKKLVSALIALTLVSLTVFPAIADAQGSAGQGLEISPPLLDLKADPGKTIKTPIRVRNVTQGKLVIKAEFEDFVAQGEDGQPKILLNKDEKSPYSLKEWLSSPVNLALSPGQRETVELTINVPKDASPGGHYGVIRFTGTPPETEENTVSLSASVGTLLLVNVAGDAKQSAKVAELFTSQNGKKRGWFEYGPVDITTRVQNDGNIHFQPKGTIQVTNMFGRTSYVGQLNEANRNVLPGSIRKFEHQYGKKILFGRYKVRADIIYGSDNQIATATKTFWAIPYKLIIAVIAAIALLVFLLKGYNRLIINRAKGKQNGGKAPKKAKKGK